MRALWLLHAGRVGAYTMLGAISGAMAGGFGLMLRLDNLQTFFQILASLSLVWTGASIAGFLPIAVRSNTVFSGIANSMQFRIKGPASLLSFGAAWGCAPCTMVYSALLTASLTGAVTTSALFMLSFGVATIPALATIAASQLFLHRKPFMARNSVRRAIGVILIVAAVANVALPRLPPAPELCFLS